MSAAPFMMSNEEAAQRRDAIDPTLSAFVSANAGSGKTTVLTQRIIRLLLEGVNPSQILALTYTKAAAAEMLARVFKELGEWVALDDTQLNERIETIGAARPDAAGRAKARRLFAEALETPGGLRIQTVHAFAESLLHLFPFEANVPARFSVLDDLKKAELMARAVAGATEAALLAQDARLAAAFDRLTGFAAQDTVEAMIGEALRSHGAAVKASAGTIRASGVDIRLRLACGVGKAERLGDIDLQIVAGGIPETEWPMIAAAIRNQEESNIKLANCLAAAAQAASLASKAESYASAFLTSEWKPLARIGTKQTPDALRDRLSIERDRIAPLVAHRAMLELLERTEALFLFADEVRRRFEAEKQGLGALDFDDLIERTETLLSRVEAQWVLYKLDSRITHLLIDEAQDTSPRQWSILRKLTADFFSGAGQRGPIRRTVFAVGDEKQSIYSFQGASPASFGEERDHYRRAALAADLEFKKLEFRLSFRSTEDVLSAVDKSFAAPEHFAGLSSDAVKPVHEARRRDEPGLVEVWPAIPKPEKAERDAFDPVDAPAENAPAVQLAQRIARHAAIWTKQGHHFEDDGQPIRPGDILILVRKRSLVFDAVIRELKRASVPVAGADRLKLGEHIAVEDLFALADALLNAENDLALATVLKSPLIGCDDVDLMALTESQDGSLWDRLLAAQQPHLAQAARLLTRWRGLARENDPFNFYATILSAEQGREKLLQRLGMDAAEAIDVFLADVFEWQRQNPPSLAAFVAAMRTIEREVKREMEESSGAVRVMTVHAAKGLEARIVILADTFSAPGTSQDKLIALAQAKGDAAPLACLTGGVKPRPDIIQTATDRRLVAEQEEYRRLLYVAMTRARDRLYVTGFMPGRSVKGPWHEQIWNSLSALPESAMVMADDGGGEVLRYRKVRKTPVDAKPTADSAKSITALPEWWGKPAKPADAPRPPLRPSNPQDAADRSRPQNAGGDEARRRGALIHALLERLPAVPPERRPGAALAILQARGARAVEMAGIIESVEAVLASPDFAFLFGPQSRSEAAIAGVVTLADGGTRDVRGRIDRLAVSAERVVCVDFKTGRPTTVPDAAMLRQLALYRSLLGSIYPGRRIDAGILWTSAPRLDFADPAELAAAFSEIAVS